MFRNRRREGGENVEERVRLIIQTARPEYFLGESIALQFIVVNEGTSPLEISVGGDYRGVGRHLRYKVRKSSAIQIITTSHRFQQW